jgi:hypothetical protein
MKSRSPIGVAILAAILVGCLLSPRPARATNSVWVTGGSGTCGQGGGYAVSSWGTYTADDSPFGWWPGCETPVIHANCVTVRREKVSGTVFAFVFLRSSLGANGAFQAQSTHEPRNGS